MTHAAPTHALHDHLMDRFNPPPGADASAAVASAPIPNLVKRLIEGGADVNAPDRDGLTPLLRCLSWPYASSPDAFKVAAHEVIDLLLAHGADMTATTPDGRTAANLAAVWGDAQLALQKLDCEAYRRSAPDLMTQVERICTSWPKPDAPATAAVKRRFFSACKGGLTQEVAYLLHIHRAAATWHDDFFMDDRTTPLMWAILGGIKTHDVVTLLLKNGSDVNWQDNAGDTALHHACISHTLAEGFIPILIAANPDLTLTNKKGETARDVARARFDPEILDIFDRCVATMADINEALNRIASKATHGAITRHRRNNGGKFKL